jgi:hypothetical protein
MPDADTVVVPRAVLKNLYDVWLRHHSCYSGACRCDNLITHVDAALAQWEGLTPPYATIVADPPWQFKGGGLQRKTRLDGEGTR